jgi:3-phenylpropionate/cinnamic acid dioxygenase small subunit
MDRDTYVEAVDFLHREAALLDGRRLRDWQDLLTEDIQYLAPLRQTVEEKDEDEFSDRAYLFREHWDSIDTRIKRIETEYAWSENPPQRTRHHVSTVRVLDDDGEELSVRSNLLLYRTQRDQPKARFISCERRDTLRRVDGDLKLARREAYVDSTVLDINYLTVFL